MREGEREKEGGRREKERECWRGRGELEREKGERETERESTVISLSPIHRQGAKQKSQNGDERQRRRVIGTRKREAINSTRASFPFKGEEERLAPPLLLHGVWASRQC